MSVYIAFLIIYDYFRYYFQTQNKIANAILLPKLT